MGGSWMLRGYGGEYFSGDRCVSLQAEYRYPIWKLFSGVLFSEVGLVDDEQGSAHGIGLRIGIPPDGNIKARFDLGFTQEGEMNFYVNFKHVF